MYPSYSDPKAKEDIVANKADQDLSTLKSILVGDEVKAMQDSIKRLESSVASDIKAIKSELTKAMDELRASLEKQVSGLLQSLRTEEKNRSESFVSLENRLNVLVADVNTKTQNTDKQARDGLAMVRQEIDQKLSAAKNESQMRFKGVDDNIVRINEDLKLRKAESAKIAQFLSGFARTIAEPAVEAAPAEQPKAQQPAQRVYHAQSATSAKKADAGQSDLPGGEDLLNNIDNLFNLQKGK
jgi:ElaB/YqjD/DUF883 family membrane-anchored ribosome-binding protein